MTFARGDQVVWLYSGKEIPANVEGSGTDRLGEEIYVIDVDGVSKNVKKSEILPVKKPGFEIRDLAFVLNESKDSMQGEIIATGIGPKKRMFYKLKFEPELERAQSWYSEDEVFTISSSSENS